MSTPDQPGTPPLTRRQMRELRNTASTPVITSDAEAPAEEPSPAAPPTPLPRAAAPAPVAPAPAEQVDIGVSPLTRRQARQQERIRTASVPIITPDAATPPAVIAAVPASDPGVEHVRDDEQTSTPAQTPTSVDSPVEDASDDAGANGSATLPEPAVEEDVDALPDDRDEDRSAASIDEDDEAAAILDIAEDEDEAPVVQVNPALGSELLVGEVPVAALPASFDQLIARSASATGSVATPNALILSQTPAGAPLVAPVTATGEVLITGTFELPEGLGSVGHAPGTADGKDLDIALIDGELPPASSPTPIAASAAISTVRNSGEEIIRPPLPDKSHRVTLALVITIGVLALAVAGVLVFAITTGRI